ncbi:MAG: hypothetical protein ACRESV_06260, partial [Nevskiales bacterium]
MNASKRAGCALILGVLLATTSYAADKKQPKPQAATADEVRALRELLEGQREELRELREEMRQIRAERAQAADALRVATEAQEKAAGAQTVATQQQESV